MARLKERLPRGGRAPRRRGRPDLRGFGESDRHDEPPASAYSADAQASSVLALADELGLGPLVLVGFDIGSRVAQTIARRSPERVRALVLSPPLPGAGERVLGPDMQPEFWYQAFHQLGLSEALLDGRPEAVRAYLGHFWSHWSAAGWELGPDRLDALVELYGAPGAFRASVAWYRAGGGTVRSAPRERAPEPAERLAVPTSVLWGEEEPLFPVAWSDRLGEFFADFELSILPGVGHFAPLEAPKAIVEEVRRRVAT